MTWIKLADSFPDHPKVLEAGDLAAWLYVAGLCFCSRHLTDGHIPDGAVSRLTGVARPKQLASRLVEVGLWVRCADGYRIHDYTEHQRSAAAVAEIRDAARERQRRHRDVTPLSRRDKRVTNANVTQPETDNREQIAEGGLAPSARSRRKPKVPIPDPFVLTDEMVAWVTREYPTLDHDAATREWVSAAKRDDWRFANWEQGWRNGMHRAARWHVKSGPSRTHLGGPG